MAKKVKAATSTQPSRRARKRKKARKLTPTEMLPSIAQALELPPVDDIPATRRLISRLSAYRTLLRSDEDQPRLLGAHPFDWRHDDRYLISIVVKGNGDVADVSDDGDDAAMRKRFAEDEALADKAMFELVRRDPRHLGSELVQGKIALWRMQAMYAHKRRAVVEYEDGPESALEVASIVVSERPHRRRSVTAQQAKKKLRSLAEAVKRTTGGGNSGFVSRVEIRERYEDILARLKRARAFLKRETALNSKAEARVRLRSEGERTLAGLRGDGASNADVAEKSGLRADQVARIRDADIKNLGLIYQAQILTGDDFGLGQKSVEAYLSDARTRKSKPSKKP